MGVVAGWNAGDTLTLLAIAAGLVSFVHGVRVYRRQQAWNRRLHVIDRMDAMVKDPLCRTALLALDWIRREIVLDEDNAKLVGAPTLDFTERMLVDALAVNFHQKDPKLVYLRDCFSAFCDQLMVLSSMKANGLLRIEDIAPFLGYHAERLLQRGGIRSAAVNKALLAFVDHFYDQEEILAFLEEVLAEYDRPKKRVRRSPSRRTGVRPAQ